MPYYVYILECADGSYYVGTSFDPDLRLEQHNEGRGGAYTVKRLPVKMRYVEEHVSEPVAVQRERQIKRWTRDKKSALIAGNLSELHRLSRRKRAR
jgi:putative endonuclease